MLCDAATLKPSSSLRKNRLCASPSGSTTSSRAAVSYGFPVTTSMIRPATPIAALLYENTFPSGVSCGTFVIPATYCASASSPWPVSSK